MQKTQRLDIYPNQNKTTPFTLAAFFEMLVNKPSQ